MYNDSNYSYKKDFKYKFHIKIPLAEIYVKPGEGKELKKTGNLITQQTNG